MLRIFPVNYSNLAIALAAAIAVGLAGCGGSSGGAAPPAFNAQVNGTAAKGIIINGIVTAQELDATGASVRTVGSALTGADGTYDLTLGGDYDGGPIQITITSDGSTTMKCDVPAGCGTTDGVTPIDFGDAYTPSSLTMTALLPGAAVNATISASVTPYTHAAAELAKASGNVDAAAVASANSEISNLLGGIDILNTPPVDITDPAAVNASGVTPTQITYAALAAALANQGLPTGTNGQPDLDQAIALLASSLAAGTIGADDSGDPNDDTAISLQEIVDAAAAAFSASGVSDLTGVMADLQSDIVTALTGDGTIDPVPGDTSASGTIAQARAFINDVRTWGTVIENEIAASQSTFDTQVTMASAAIDAVTTDSIFEALGAAVEVAFLYDGINTNLASYDLLANTFDSGTITGSSGTVTITNGVVHGYTVNMTASLPADGASGTTFVLGITSASIDGIDNSMDVNSGTVSVTLASSYTIDYDALDLGTAAPLPDITGADFDLDVSLTQVNDSLGSPLASPVTFAGALSFDLDPIPVASDPLETAALPGVFELSGSISNTQGESFDASLVLNVSNTGSYQVTGDFAAPGTTYSSLHAGNMILTWAYTDTDTVPGNDTFTLSTPVSSGEYYWDASSGLATITYTSTTLNGSSTLGTYASLAEALADNLVAMDQSIPIADEGTYFVSVAGADFDSDGGLDGTLTDPEYLYEIDATDRWIDFDAGLTFTVQLTGLPEARINVTADRTGFEAADATVTIAYGTRQLVIAGSASTATASGSLTISNQDNIVLTIDPVDLTATTPQLVQGTLTFNGVEYATLSETSNGLVKITYADGTFEVF